MKKKIYKKYKKGKKRGGQRYTIGTIDQTPVIFYHIRDSQGRLIGRTTKPPGNNRTIKIPQKKIRIKKKSFMVGPSYKKKRLLREGA